MWKIYPKNINYECSELGEIRNVKTKRILKPKIRKDGYYDINLHNNGNQKTERVHRIVLETFQPVEDSNLFDVNHINGIKTDNNLQNLEWMPAKVNRGIKMNEQRGEIVLLINDLIQQIGFEETKKELKKLLDKPLSPWYNKTMKER